MSRGLRARGEGWYGEWWIRALRPVGTAMERVRKEDAGLGRETRELGCRKPMRLVNDEVVEVVGGDQQLSGSELPSVPVRRW